MSKPMSSDETATESDSGSGSGSSGSDSSSDDEMPFAPIPSIVPAVMQLELAKVNEWLVCSECKGYLRQAHTIMDCMHTFCKVCLHRHFKGQEDYDCPLCHAAIETANPMRQAVRMDRMMQSIVNTIVPHWVEKDNEVKETLFGKDFKKQIVQTTQSASTNYTKLQPKKRRKNDNNSSNNNSSSIGIENLDNEPKMVFQLVPGAHGKPVPKAFVKANRTLTMRSVKKLVAQQLGLPDSSTVVLTCRREHLGNDHTLNFIKKTRWQQYDPISHLILHYEH